VYQSGGTPPAANSWGCEGGSSKYVGSLSTDSNGVVTATITNISPDVNGSIVTLIPLAAAGTAATTTGGGNMGSGLYGWICGGTGTNVNTKYLPGSCRGN
jgi:type IV pilus assembly protein PilA